MKRVLVVEDEASIREMVALNLKMAGWGGRRGPQCRAALELMHSGERCDAATFGYYAAGHGRLDLCETIRRGDSDIGIIIVSAKRAGERQDPRPVHRRRRLHYEAVFGVGADRASGGADPPGGPPRQRRPPQTKNAPTTLVSGPFVLDEKSRILYKSGKPIDLTQVEFQIMELFFHNPGIALVREKILKGVWGENTSAM